LKRVSLRGLAATAAAGVVAVLMTGAPSHAQPEAQPPESSVDSIEPDHFEEVERAVAPESIKGSYGRKLTIPTHRSPEGGQTTHPSVVQVPGGWNGYEYWMAHTPYPGGDDQYEDPNIIASHDGVTWTVPPGLRNPVDDRPGSPGPYNSDVDLRMGPSDTMYLFWRTVLPEERQERLYYSTSTDGVTWSEKREYMRNDMSVRRLLSPSLMYENHRWVMWAVDMKPSPNQVVFLKGGHRPEDEWTAPQRVDVGPMRTDREPWHLWIGEFDGEYLGLLNDCALSTTGREGELLFLAGDGHRRFENSGESIIPQIQPNRHDELYHASMVADRENDRPGYRVWYSARLDSSPDVWNISRTFVSSR
jgi:hypothetical protein